MLIFVVSSRDGLGDVFGELIELVVRNSPSALVVKVFVLVKMNSDV